MPLPTAGAPLPDRHLTSLKAFASDEDDEQDEVVHGFIADDPTLPNVMIEIRSYVDGRGEFQYVALRYEDDPRTIRFCPEPVEEQTAELTAIATDALAEGDKLRAELPTTAEWRSP
jgi:hypothetical protein